MRKKRFTDCGKWRQRWFRELSPTAKLLWGYLCDHCDDAGVWETDWKYAEFICGYPLSRLENAVKELDGRVVSIANGYLLIPKFIAFQYPSGIREGYNPHKPVFRSLARYRLELIDGVTRECTEGYEGQALPKPSPTLQGKDKGKGTDKGIGKEEEDDKW